MFIHQRPKDGYINATELCKKAGRLFGDYRRLEASNAYLEALEADMGIPISELIVHIKGFKDAQGTWVHPYVATHLGQWLSPKFAVLVNKWINEWVRGNIKGYMPPHVERYMRNREKIPFTHFSMLNEVYLVLFAPLDDAGIRIPEKIMPDISTGKMFSFSLRKQGIDVRNFPTYPHEFHDKKIIVQARLYPIELLPRFKEFFHTEWVPNRAQRYFQDKFPTALPYIKQIKVLSEQQAKFVSQ